MHGEMEITPPFANADNRSPRPFNPAQPDTAPVASSPTRDPYSLTSEQAAARYNVSKRTLATWRANGMPFLLPGPRKVLYLTADADAWVRAKFSVGRPKPTLERLARAGGAGA